MTPRLKTKPGMARFDFKLNMGRITPEQAKGLKYVSGGYIASQQLLTPKQANRLLTLLVKMMKEDTAESQRKVEKLGNLAAMHGLSHDDIDEMLKVGAAREAKEEDEMKRRPTSRTEIR